VFGNVLPELTGWAFQRSDERILQLQVFSFLYDATKEVFDCKYTNWIRVQEISSDFHYHLYTAFVLENRIDSLQLRAKLDYIISLELDALEAQIALQRLALHYMHELVQAVVSMDMSAANVCQGYADRYWIQSKYKSLKRSEARQQFYKILLNLERPDQILSEYIDSARELQRQANASALDLEVAWTTLRATYDLFVPGVLVD
jgi:hypothetical protein